MSMTKPPSKSFWRRVRDAGVPQQIVLGFLALLTLYPFFFLLMSSFKNNEQFFKQF